LFKGYIINLKVEDTQEFVYVLAWEQNGQKCDLEKAQSIKNTIERIIKVKK